MKKILNSIGILTLSVLLFSCSNLELLQKTKKMGLVGVTYDKNFVQLNDEGNEVEKSLLSSVASVAANSIAKGDLDLETKVDPNVEKFLNKIKDDVVKAFASNEITVIDAKDFKDKEALKDLKIFNLDPLKMSDRFSPEPYGEGCGGNLSQSKALEVIKKENLDAGLFIQCRLVKQETGWILKEERLGLQLIVAVINKDGDNIFNFIRYIEYGKFKSDFGKSIGGLAGGIVTFFGEDLQTKKDYEQIRQKIISSLKSTIYEALSK